MAQLAHHHDQHGTPTRTATILKALLTLVLVTAVFAAGTGLATYAVSKLLVAALNGLTP